MRFALLQRDPKSSLPTHLRNAHPYWQTQYESLMYWYGNHTSRRGYLRSARDRGKVRDFRLAGGSDLRSGLTALLVGEEGVARQYLESATDWTARLEATGDQALLPDPRDANYIAFWRMRTRAMAQWALGEEQVCPTELAHALTHRFVRWIDRTRTEPDLLEMDFQEDLGEFLLSCTWLGQHQLARDYYERHQRRPLSVPLQRKHRCRVADLAYLTARAELGEHELWGDAREVGKRLYRRAVDFDRRDDEFRFFEDRPFLAWVRAGVFGEATDVASVLKQMKLDFESMHASQDAGRSHA